MDLFLLWKPHVILLLKQRRKCEPHVEEMDWMVITFCYLTGKKAPRVGVNQGLFLVRSVDILLGYDSLHFHSKTGE